MNQERNKNYLKKNTCFNVTEKKWRSSTVISNEDLLVYSGVEQNLCAKAGVACIINQNKINAIRNWEGIN